MAVVRIENGCLHVDDERIPLWAGELHYWRVNPARWPTLLGRMRELGLNVIATYIPWQYHELEPGRFDFDGRTEPPRSLVGFLDLLQRMGFWIFIRPGPYIYAEWTNAGVPDRVVTLPRLGAAYRVEASTWIEAVSDVLRPYLATRGGRIVALQPDNEFDLFSHWFEHACGFTGDQPGFFQQFLATAYNDVATLNSAWGTSLHSFDEARPLAVRTDARDPHALVQHKDYWRFQHWATAEGVRWHAEEYRRCNIDVPLVANYYPGGDVQNWREVSKVVDFCGIDWYPQSEFNGDADAQRRFMDTCRYQRAFSPIPFIAEWECGVWHGFHEYVGALPPNHYRLMGFAALAAGIQAFNWYMFVGRDNWYYCPINERGDVRPELADVFCHFHRVVTECDPPSLTKCASASVLLEPVHIATDQALRDNSVLAALHEADIDYEIYDPELDAIRKPVLFYAGADWLPAVSQRRLVEYVEAGGTLVLFQNYPRRDECFNPHNGLGITPPDEVLSPLGKKVEVNLGGHRALVEGPVWCWKHPPGESISGTQSRGVQQAVENADKWMEQYVGRQWTCGYREPRGRGTVIVLGLPPNAAFMRAVHCWLDQPLYAHARLPGVTTALYQRNGDLFLFATNLNDCAVQAGISLDGVELADDVRVEDLWAQTVETMPREHVTIALARRSGGAWRLRSA